MNISQYKTKVASHYMPLDPEQIGLKIMEVDYYFTSIKHDGYFAARQCITAPTQKAGFSVPKTVLWLIKH